MDMMQKGYTATFGITATHPEHHYLHRAKGGDAEPELVVDFHLVFYLPIGRLRSNFLLTTSINT